MQHLFELGLTTIGAFKAVFYFKECHVKLTYLFWHLIWVCIEMCDLYGTQSIGNVWQNRGKTEKPWKESAFVATTAKLYLLIRLTLLLS
ncbi:hypothetical protein T09_12953 [Trichinella sp. T9]|nr:hypothetical protein T09_12953 [Trichinella sp. T9]